MKTTQNIDDDSKDYLQSRNAPANVTLKSRFRPIVGLWKGKSTDNSELMTVSRRSESQLTNFVKWSWLRFLFLVSPDDISTPPLLTGH
jgi:hypothetical protein